MRKAAPGRTKRFATAIYAEQAAEFMGRAPSGRESGAVKSLFVPGWSKHPCRLPCGFFGVCEGMVGLRACRADTGH